jgi:hypothetical protein
VRYLVIFKWYLVTHSVLINLQKCYCNNTYKSTYKSNILRQEGFRGFGFPHNKQKQDEPPPHPQHFCPIMPWHHPPWPQIMVPQLPMSLLKAPGGGFAINMACSFAWGAKRDPSRNREMGRVQVLGGCQSFKKHNNQPKESVGGWGGV